eukprot:c2342_g1_i1.p1 GENE.c2342_g1_i1~~c2342_g1_i1.p1  ORF type:complete len:114 (+),score=32.05 c2342_g1_i1:103-444(+)
MASKKTSAKPTEDTIQGCSIRSSEMPDQLKVEVVQVARDLCHKSPGKLETIATELKQYLDGHHGETWNVVVGDSFALNVSYEQEKFIYFSVPMEDSMEHFILCFKTFERYVKA